MSIRIVGYARVSTIEQNLDSQKDALVNAGCTRIFEESVSGTRASRPEWDKALDYLREGDTLVITRLDRAGRDLRHLLTLLDELRERRIQLKVLEQSVDTESAAGRLFLHMVAVVAEFEHDLIVERVREGLKAARARGRVGGRPAVLSTERAQAEVQRLYDARTMTVGEIADMFNVSRASIYRALRRDIAKKLTAQDVRRIKELHRDDDWTPEQIAADMDLSVGLVQRALSLDPIRKYVDS